ncbi:hypothetical protein [Cellulomonas sp. Root137]|uniref:hypothetical protein n=1 Tax=Cellulomonas sp. Root137 TaxID=1736459 RepID=UPI0006F9837B|nr:hypothetical protein [Cellulomonas sp. Root137]KQY44662.1 hypothetical protein ASD18_14345 [Cellulomonas sp. Root137]
MTRPPPHALAQACWAALVVLTVSAFGLLAVRDWEADLAAAWGQRPTRTGELWWYASRWPLEIVGWLVLVWAATRRLASTGSRAVHVPLGVGLVLVAASLTSSLLGGPGLVWAGPVGLLDGGLLTFARSWWWGVSGPVVVSVALLVTCWLARRGARPSSAPATAPLLEAGALVAIPLVSLAFAAVALTASAFGVGDALVVSGLPFVLVALAALAASGGGRTSTVAVLLGLLLLTGLSLLWRPAAYLPFFAVGCALALVPTARGIEWLTAPRRPVPASAPGSVAEGADADDRART